ncbi:roadblock/LC7 domain-containing protein [Streptomyces verrucosisporus]|uniref:roadblock/LC7 domain-containing protein n=1 Tax=Streptomyces TaxID=1883 RepID=UPI0019D24434|nr:roadblock/LC7 domain-containing protein [Streptomyces verrucosisporus]MBN3932964.1 roadblock/LC7 domain-containing protein [Streptomyces verrucosisporus]
MSAHHSKAADLGRILDTELIEALPGVLRAVLVSRDGLVVTTSNGVERNLADTMAAAASGLLALSRQGAAFADCSDSPLELTLIQYGDGYLVGMAAGEDTYLVVAAKRNADVETLSYAAQKTVDRIGRVMGVGARSAAGPQS